jgi:ABC-type antimicrobial peptide transport system permease subunit
MALGARPDQIRARFFSLALRLLATGTLLGLCGAWLTGRAMQSILFHVPVVHFTTLAAAVSLISAVALVACLLPAHRASRISPMEALNDS